MDRDHSDSCYNFIVTEDIDAVVAKRERTLEMKRKGQARYLENLNKNKERRGTQHP